MSRPAWAADYEVDLEQARTLIETQFPAFAGQDARILGRGFDNLAVQIGTAVFRFPRAQLGAHLLDTELTWLPRLGPRLELAIPLPRWIGQPAGDYPYPFAGYSLLPGQTGCSFAWTRETRAQLVKPLARTLRALHDTPTPPDPPGDELDRANLPARAKDMLEHLDELAAAWPELDLDALTQRAHAWSTAPREHGRCWVHGDLYARHVLVREGGTPTALIDWGDMHVGDPCLDLVIVPAMLAREDWPRFFAHYGPVTPAAWTRARFRALYGATIMVHYGHSVSDQALQQAGRHTLRVLLEDPLV